MLVWSTMSVIIGECLALRVMTTLSHKLQLWQCAGGALLHQLFVGALVFVLSAVYGNEYHLGMKNTIKMIDNMIKMHINQIISILIVSLILIQLLDMMELELGLILNQY